MVEVHHHPIHCPDCGHALRYVADEPLTKRLVCWPRGCEAEFAITLRIEGEFQRRTLHRISDQVRTGEPIPLDPIRIAGG